MRQRIKQHREGEVLRPDPRQERYGLAECALGDAEAQQDQQDENEYRHQERRRTLDPALHTAPDDNHGSADEDGEVDEQQRKVRPSGHILEPRGGRRDRSAIKRKCAGHGVGYVGHEPGRHDAVECEDEKSRQHAEPCDTAPQLAPAGRSGQSLNALDS